MIPQMCPISPRTPSADGHLAWAQPAGSWGIWKLFPPSRLRDALHTHTTRSPCNSVCFCMLVCLCVGVLVCLCFGGVCVFVPLCVSRLVLVCACVCTCVCVCVCVCAYILHLKKKGHHLFVCVCVCVSECACVRIRISEP